MIKLTLPKETIRPTGIFYDNMLEASARGCNVKWNKRFTFATQKLDTSNFLTVSDVIKLINNGGEVEGYKYVFHMSKEDFVNKPIPDELMEYLGIQLESLDEEGNPIQLEVPTYKDIFKFYTKNFPELTEEEINNGTVLSEDDYVSVDIINSVNMEYLPMSISLILG